ncbi:MAG: alpha/beta hydrolase [Polyangiales bacterium]|jgi:alpha-beta hydrolase superfamily lysophospholipase
MTHPVAVFPGFSAGDLSTFALRRHLQGRGFRVHRWRLGLNRGDVPALVPQVLARTETLFERYGEPVSLVGWSLGGVLAREVARERPEIVQGVVTLGSPVIGGPKYTRAAGFYKNVLNADLDEIERAVDERNRIPIEVPLTAIYSKRDKVVQWEACIDNFNAHCNHIEVDASHLSLGFDPKVLRLVGSTVCEYAA